MPLVIPTIKEIRNRIVSDMNSRLTGADALLPNSFLNVLATVFAMAIYPVYLLIEYVLKQIDPSSAEGKYLDRHGTSVRLTRKAASPGLGKIVISGNIGSTLQANSEIQRGDGQKYLTIDTIELTTSPISVSVIAENDGAISNAAAGVKCSLVNPVLGIKTECTVDEDGITGGTDAETDDEYRARILDRMKEPFGIGNDNDYKQWALSVPGVTRAWVYPQELGYGNVTVRIASDVGPQAPIPSDDLVASAKAYIEKKRPLGVRNLQVLAPVAKPVEFTIDLLPDDQSTRSAVKASLEALFRKEAEPGSVVLISHIRQAISNAVGEYDNTLIAPTADVMSDKGELLVVGEITWQ